MLKTKCQNVVRTTADMTGGEQKQNRRRKLYSQLEHANTNAINVGDKTSIKL